MKPEVIIRNWLMAWFKPDVLTEYNTQAREPLTETNFGQFIACFKDERNENQFSEDEAKTLKKIITNPLQLASGYPRNTQEALQLGSIYIVEGGWQQASSHLGANYWEGRATTHIAVTGLTAGETLNMEEPSLLLKVVTSLLIAGRNYFTAYHLLNPVITETLYAQDDNNSNQQKFAIRSLSMAYDAKRHGVMTNG